MYPKSVLFFTCILWVFDSLYCQVVTNYKYVLSNGSVVVTEKGWNWTRAAQKFISLDSVSDKSTLKINIVSVGTLIEKSTILSAEGKPITELSNTAPGEYTFHIICDLTESLGKISFDVKNVSVKPKMQTVVNVSVHDILVRVTEKNEKNQGLSYYEVKLDKYKGNQGVRSVIHFFPPGDTKTRVYPSKPGGDYYGSTKPGNYDVRLLYDINMAGFVYTIMLQNLAFKQDYKYYILVDLNGAELRLAIEDYKYKAIHLFPAGTADSQNGAAKMVREKKIYGFERPQRFTLCPPGVYDVLLDYDWGVKYEWRKNIVCTVHNQTEVK